MIDLSQFDGKYVDIILRNGATASNVLVSDEKNGSKWNYSIKDEGILTGCYAKNGAYYRKHPWDIIRVLPSPGDIVSVLPSSHSEPTKQPETIDDLIELLQRVKVVFGGGTKVKNTNLVEVCFLGNYSGKSVDIEVYD